MLNVVASAEADDENEIKREHDAITNERGIIVLCEDHRDRQIKYDGRKQANRLAQKAADEFKNLASDFPRISIAYRTLFLKQAAKFISDRAEEIRLQTGFAKICLHGVDHQIKTADFGPFHCLSMLVKQFDFCFDQRCFCP